MSAIKILIADDHQLFRDGLKALLDSAPDMDVVAEATTGREAVAMVSKIKPDLVLMDVQMPDMNGVEAARQIVNEIPETKVLMLTMFDDDHSVFAAMRAGARGYLLKGAKHREVLRAIQATHHGEAIFSPAIATRMIDFFSQMRAAEDRRDVFTELTEREREVLALLARNYSNADIAAELVISPKTVRNYVSNILSKLQVVDRYEAASQARDAGLG